MNYSKAYPYLKALLDGLIEAAPNWTKAPAKFISSLSEQLKDQSEAEVRQLEQEIKGITKDELEAILKEAGCVQREHIELIVKTVEIIPEFSQKMDYRFDKVEAMLEEITNLLKLRTGKPLYFPLNPHHTNITPPEPNFVGRIEMLETITEWYKNPDVHIGALIGWGGEGKSSIARKWYDSLEKNGIKPDGIFWWGFYRNPYLDRFLDSLLDYLAQGRINLNEIKSTWAKVDKINELIREAEYLIILDGFEEMQKGEERGTEFGCMAHRELTEILTNLADSKSKGLCLITTRYPLTDIKNWEGSTYAKADVERLSLEDSRLLFERIGIKGDQEEVDGVIEEYKGHALSLTLLAKYLIEDFKGDIKKAKEIPPFHSDKEAGGKAHRILLWYAKQLSQEQLIFMKIFSLFRRSVNEKDFEGVFRSEMETEINEQLRNMSLFSFKRMVDNLCDRRLITKGQDDTYTTHPLIKNYFESIFEEEDKKFCHKKIYQYIGTYAPEKPETLEEMQPLFEQVYHGCKARLYDEVLDSIYYGKIRLQNFLTWKLGCWDTNLTLIQNFFKQGDIYTEPLVSKSKDKGRLINQAALSIMNLGKIEEAKSLYEKTISLFTSQDEWKYASIVYQHLSELQRLTGYLLDAKTSSEKAVKLSIKAKDVREKHNSTACLAYVLFLLGKRDNAAIEFRKAFELQEEFNPIERYLYSIDGIWHTDFLITQNRIEEAFKVSSENMKICKKNGWIADISRCCRSLASLERIKRNFDKSEEHINDALEIACKIGMPELEVEALVEFGKLKLETKDYKGAEADSNQALKLIDRTGFKLYEPDAEVVLAKVYLALGDMDKAKEFANSAYKKASEMHYHWPKVEAEELLKEISH